MDEQGAALSSPTRVWIPIAIVVLVVAVVAVGAWMFATRDPGPNTVFRLRVPVDRARDAGVIEPETNTDEFVTRIARVLVDRLERLDLSDVTFTVDDNEIELTAYGVDDETRRVALDVLTRSGRVEFRIEVRPDEQYPEHDRRWRTRLWTGSTDEFDAFKAAEIERWRAARERNPLAVYEPQDPRYRIVPRRGTDGFRSEDFVVVEEPGPAVWQPDGRILENPRIGQDVRGMPVVIFDVRREDQDRFSEFTGANVGLPLAIVLGGETDIAPIIQEPLSDSIQIFLGNLSFSAARDDARALVAALSAGSLPVRPIVVSVQTGEDDERNKAFQDAEARVLSGVAQTVLDLVRGEPWNWGDGHEGMLGDLYGRHLRLSTAEQTDLLDAYTFELGLSRPALGGFEDADAAEASAPPIRVSVVVRSWDGDALARREGTVTEAEARAVDGEALLEAFRARHASIEDAFETLLAP